MRLVHNLGIFVLLVSSCIDVSIGEPRVVCYYTNWSVYRPGTAKFNPQNINPYLCTHLIYAFGGFTKDNQLKPFDKYQDIEQGGYAKFTGLKTYNKELKTMLAIGGWNEGSTRFSPLVASADRRAQLVKNSIKFLRQNKFDGLDLDWEYPAFRDGGKAKDRENYAKLVQELREEFDREHQKTGRPRLLLTMAVPAGFEYIDKGYDVPKLNKHLDWFNLLSYDYHSAYEPSVNHHAPLYPIEEENEYSFDNDLNINATINYYLKHGADRDKLVLGIPTYGRSYTLFNPDSNEIGAPADGPGEQGDATREKGYLAYYEICQSLKEDDSEWTVVQPNPEALGPYAYNDNQWVGYDDEDIVRRKSEFVVEQKLGGIMFWSIDNDDFRGLCNGKQYPLIEAAKESYLDGIENGVQRKSQSGSNKRKQQQQTTKRPDSKKSAFGKTTTPPPPTTPASGTDFKCEEEGFFPHPSDCKKYFWCLEAPGLGLVAHHFSCPSGLLFNKQADSCDYARNVFCSTKQTTTSTTSTSRPTTEASTTEKVIYNKVSSVYKNPSRTTPRTTTTISSLDFDVSELGQEEDPKVIKELIELIKKAGGIEELEKQINAQEENSNAKNDKQATTPASIIKQSLVDKIKNRSSLFKPRAPIFNGASQPEKVTAEKKSSSSAPEQTTVSASPVLSSKKYNSINRFSRPQPQNTGIDALSESEAVLIEKPQYSSIARRKPVKPDVVAENDYNNDPEKSTSVEETSKASEVSKKYATISRTRRPQQTIVEEPEESEESAESDDEIEIEEVPVRTTTSTKAPSKYINLSRRRSTTAAPVERSESTSEPATSSVASRRKPATATEKTEVTRTVRRRPSVSRTTTENIQQEEEYTPRPTYSYRPGYRGTARFRLSTTRSGEYDQNDQFVNDNRLRSLNIERSNRRPPTTQRTSTTTEESVTRRRPSFSRTRLTTTTTEAPEDYEEISSTTEARIVESKGKFSLNNNERPERLRFELTAGGKINFGYSSVKSRENKTNDSDQSKVKIITGPLEKSPLISTRDFKKGRVEEIPITKAPENVRIKSFSNKLNLNEIPLNKSDIESFVPDEQLKTDSPIEETTLKRRLRPSVVGFKNRLQVKEESTTEYTDDEFETTTLPFRIKNQNRFSQIERTRVQSDIKNDLSNSEKPTRTLSRDRADRGRNRNLERNGQTPRKSELRPILRNRVTQQENESSSPRGFQSRFSATTTQASVSTKYLTRVKASDFLYKARNINALEDSENSETQDVIEESTLRVRFKPSRKGFAPGLSSQETSTDALDSYELVTEKSTFSIEDENDIEYTTQVGESEKDTTVASILTSITKQTPTRRLTIRKRPAKKIDFLATRQTITEANGNNLEGNSDNTSDASIFDEDLEGVEIDTTSTRTTEVRTRPTRRVVTRKRIIPKEEFEPETTPTAAPIADEENKNEFITQQQRPRTTTRKRVLTIRTKDGVIKSEVELKGDSIETSTEASTEEPKTRDPNLRKRIRVFRTRPTTERTEETSSIRSIVARTRVFKRPVSTEETPSEAINEEEGTTAKPRARFSTRRKVVKVSRRPSPVIESESEKSVDVENVSESTTSAPRKSYKIVRTKTPRLLVDKPLEEDSLVVKNDNENQDIEEKIEEEPEKEQNTNNEESVDAQSEEPARPILKFPTKSGARVTIRRRPAFGQNARTSTVHPASTRFASKEGSQPTRKQVTIRRKFRPSSVSSEPVNEEISSEKKIQGERNKKFFKSYRKFSTTSSPNITPQKDTASETEYDDVIDTTEISLNNNDGILQTTKTPRFSLSRFTTSTTPKPTTLHHVFEIGLEEDEMNAFRNMTEDNNADEVIKKLQKLIEINRIVEVYSKEEKLKLLKNKKLKSIKEGELTVERPPALDKYGEISRQVIVKLVKKSTPNETVEARSPKSVMFAETVFGNAETSTISLEGLFEREKKELEQKKENEKNAGSESKVVETVPLLVPLLRPESNETNPLVISIANLDQVILSKVQRSKSESDDTTPSSIDETTTVIDDVADD